MDPDQPGGQAAEVLGVADHALQPDQAEHQPAQPAYPARRPGQLQAHREHGGQGAQHPADVRVQLGDALQRQVVARHIRGAPAGVRHKGRSGQRPGPGDYGARREHQRHHGHQDHREHPQIRADQPGGRPVPLGAARPERHGQRQDRAGQQEVNRDRGRVEVGQHHDPAQHRLGHDAERLGGGQPDDGAPPGAGRAETPGRDHDEHGHDHEREGQHPVGELDVGVHHRVTAGAGRHQAAGSAVRPVGAAEAGRAEAHRGAGHDDPGVRHHPGHRDPAHRRRGGEEEGRGPGAGAAPGGWSRGRRAAWRARWRPG